MGNRITNRVTICQAWFVISTATFLGMPTVKELAAEIPGAIKDAKNLSDSTTSTNKLANTRKAMVKPISNPQNPNTQPINMTYKPPMLEKLSTSFPHRQNR